MRYTLILMLGALLLAGCETGPRDIQMGAEECAHCRMFVSEERFATQLRTEQGRSHVFDSIECMAEYALEAEETGEPAIGDMWVSDFGEPGNWLLVGDAVYLQSSGLRSPMGLNLSAYADRQAATAAQQEFGGEIMNWSGVLELVRTVDVATTMGHHAH